MDNESLNTGNDGILSVPLNRKLETVPVYVHELLDMKKNIKKGIPIHWGVSIFWSLFCLCFGPVLIDALTKDDFRLIYFIKQASSFYQMILCGSFLGSLTLFIWSKNKNSAEDHIDRILKQCNYEKEEEVANKALFKALISKVSKLLKPKKKTKA